MIRIVFMTDAARVIGATDEAANNARFAVLPEALHGVMSDLINAPHVVVGRASLGPWRSRTSSQVYVLTRNPASVSTAPHITTVTDYRELVDRFAHSDEELLVAGGFQVFKLFLPYADRLDVAETDDLVAGDIVFSDWQGRFLWQSEDVWPGGRTKHYTRRSRGLNNAISLYLEGIRDGRAREAVTAYTGDRYRQHSTGVRDGIEGFVEFFEPFLERNPKRDIRVQRGLEDGRHLFLHVYQSLNDGDAQWVTTDFFELDDNDRIIEHWDVISAYADETPSGHTSIDGPTEILDLDATDKNKAVVRTMIEQLLMPGGDPHRINEFIAEDYTQHNAEVADGRDAFRTLVVAPDKPLIYDEIVLLVGQGNFVATLCRARWAGDPVAQVDIFRLEDGKIVEHWDASEPALPPSESANSGKF